MAAANANAAGMMAASVKAYSPPARPQKTALTTKATSFQLAVRTPSVDAAISLVASAAARDRRGTEGAVGEQQDQQGDDPHHVVLAHVRVDLEPEEVERRHRREAEWRPPVMLRASTTMHEDDGRGRCVASAR